MIIHVASVVVEIFNKQAHFFKNVFCKDFPLKTTFSSNTTPYRWVQEAFLSDFLTRSDFWYIVCASCFSLVCKNEANRLRSASCAILDILVKENMIVL